MNKDKKKFSFKELLNTIKSFVIRNAKILGISAAIIVVIVVILLIVFRKHPIKFALNDYYVEHFPEEIRELYANMVEVSCGGDWKLDIEVDGAKTKVTDLNKNNVIDYLISYLDKQGSLSEDSVNMNVVKAAQKKLFYDNIDLDKELNGYEYGGYEYTIDGNKLVRAKKNECESGVKQVLHLYGYFSKEDKLSVDVNVAYLKDGKLYNYDNEELGEYDGDVTKLQTLTENTSYYRFNFISVKGVDKLESVEWKNRT